MALADVLLHAESIFQNVSFYLNKVIIALVIILFGFILAKIAESTLRRLSMSIGLDERLAKMFGARRNYARAIRRTIVRLIYIITAIIALDTISMLDEVLVVLLLLIVFIVLASWILAGIDVIPNILARNSLRRKNITIGNTITVAHKSGVIEGIVVDMTLTDVRIKRKNGDLFFIPNALFLETIVKKRR